MLSIGRVDKHQLVSRALRCGACQERFYGSWQDPGAIRKTQPLQVRCDYFTSRAVLLDKIDKLRAAVAKAKTKSSS